MGEECKLIRRTFLVVVFQNPLIVGILQGICVLALMVPVSFAVIPEREASGQRLLALSALSVV